MRETLEVGFAACSDTEPRWRRCSFVIHRRAVRTFVIIVALATAALVTALPRSRSAGDVFAGKNGRLVMQVAEVGGSEFGQSRLYLSSGPEINGDFIRLTRGAGHDANPAWSSDGRIIAFNSNRNTTGTDMDIWVVLPDGSGLRPVTTGPGIDVDPSWSPDGRLAFTSDRAGNLDIWTVEADGSGATRLTDSAARDEEPAWSPDGRWIAFSSRRDGNQELYVMATDGSGATRVTSSGARDRHPNWSPDGTRIAFDSNREGQFEIYTVRPDGKGLRRLTRDPAVDSRPTWSPDGREIVFQSEDQRGARHLFWIHPDGIRTGHSWGSSWQTSADWQAVQVQDRCRTRGTIFSDDIESWKGDQDDVMCMLAGNDTVRSYAGNDVIEGGPGDDSLDGGSGNDAILAGPGADTLVGGPGHDRLSCGPGQDVAYFDSADKIGRDCEIRRKLG
jgi:Tol biopolymer transport system component